MLWGDHHRRGASGGGETICCWGRMTAKKGRRGKRQSGETPVAELTEIEAAVRGTGATGPRSPITASSSTIRRTP